MKQFHVILLLIANSIFAQNASKDVLSFEADTDRNQYIVRVGKIDNNKSEVEIQMKCFMLLTNYQGKTEKIEILGVKQKVSNRGNVFFGGELQGGLYVISLSYIENGKKFTNTIEKNVEVIK